MKNHARILKQEILSDNWHTLKKITYEHGDKEGKGQELIREVYDRGNGATILLYNRESRTVVLTRQFRLPTFLNGNPSGMLIETCAGLLDRDDPVDCIKRETEEETGYKISDVRSVFEVYMSPGSVTELLFFFVAEYSKAMKVSDGGGAAHEHEDIEVLEMPFDRAWSMIGKGDIKDAKTIMLMQYAKLENLV